MQFSLKHLFYLGAIGLSVVFFPFSLFAQEPSEKLKPVFVTATKTPITLERVGGNTVTVVTSEEIQAAQQPDAAAALRNVPGIDIVNNGGPGSTTTVFIRGSDPKNTLVLIDGVMFNDPSSTDRSADLGALTLDNVERIEIIRGSQSVMYGSNATAGVINIITKKGNGPPQFSLGLMGGSYGTIQQQGSATGAINGFHYSVAGAALQSNGYSIANDRNDEIPHAGNTSEEDHYDNTTLSANVSYAFSEDHELTYIGRRIVSKKDLDDWGSGSAGDKFNLDFTTFVYVPDPDGEKKHRVDNILTSQALKLESAFVNRFFESTLMQSISEKHRNGFTGTGDAWFEYLGIVSQTSWQGAFNFETNSLVIGADRYTETMENKDFEFGNNIANVSVSTNTIWAHDQWYLMDEALILSFGVRNDNHEEFGTATTYRFAPSYQLGDIKLKMSYGTGFRAPSLFELFSLYGNNDLDPETSVTWDVGFEHQLTSSILYGSTWFDMLFDDRIAWDPIDVAPFGQYKQVDGKTTTNGLESFVVLNVYKPLVLRMDHTYTYTQDPDGKRLHRRPNHKIGVRGDYKHWDTTVFHASWQWVGERDEVSFAKDKKGEPVETLDQYNLVNVALTHDFSSSTTVFIRVDNVFDQIYETAWSFASAGRSAYAGVNVTF
ncbi:MAG: TonB-dependent receptor [SAR324 cluster bacterium]|nr:TonB-dependent receptor [SAR324 cluster bacterium]